LTEEWYSYNVYRWTREQVIWALRHREFFDDGRWPPIIGDYVTDEYDSTHKKWIKVYHSESTYIEPLINKRQIKAEAYFVKPGIIIAEIDKRMETTRDAGEALIDEIEVGITEYKLLSRPARKALDYISGYYRREQTFAQWKAEQKRKEKHKNMYFVVSTCF